MSEAQHRIQVRVSFYSFFKDLTGCATVVENIGAGTKLGEFVATLISRFPKLQPMRKSMLLAVGVEYQDRNYVLRDGDEVSLFPPVQGG